MAKLIWDKSGERDFEMGVDRGVLYLQVAGAYPAGVAWNGLISVAENPTGAELTELWADNIQYAAFRSAEKFGATVEAYMHPDEFYACNGEKEVAEGVYVGQQARQTFGLSYRTGIANDAAPDAEDYKIHLVYGATVNPSGKTYQSKNDNPEANTMSWEITTVPVAVTGAKPTAHLVIDSRKVAAAGLTALEKALYGDGATAAMLPLPDAAIALATTTTP